MVISKFNFILIVLFINYQYCHVKRARYTHVRYMVISKVKTARTYFFPGPLAFCKKTVERVRSEKNILNSSVECVE